MRSVYETIRDTRLGGPTAHLYRAIRDGRGKLELRFKKRHRIRVGPAEAEFVTESVREWRTVRRYPKTERPTLEAFVEAIRRDDTVWDVGANIGIYTYLTEDVLESGRSVAIEPYEPNVRALVDNRAINRTDTTIVPVALSDRPGESTLTLSKTDDRGATQGTLSQSPRDVVSEVPVRVSTGDELIEDRGLAPPTVMKVDVEGEGERVLAGFEDALQSGTCRTIFIEPHGNYPEIVEALDRFGYGIDREIHLDRDDRSTPSTVVGSRR